MASSGFTDIIVDIKEESREVIKQWLPGSGAENFVVSANISALKPGSTVSTQLPAPKLLQSLPEPSSASVSC